MTRVYCSERGWARFAGIVHRRFTPLASLALFIADSGNTFTVWRA